jgi:hypothetical protein
VGVIATAVLGLATLLLGIWVTGLAEVVGLVVTLAAMLAPEAKWRLA